MNDISKATNLFTMQDDENDLAGESSTLEYKRERPKDSQKYLKTVVAFANGSGGRLIFGVDDKTLKITGIPTDIVFSEIDAITNAICDGCKPVIRPEILIKDVKDKALIEVKISPGIQQPYYIKSLGIPAGVFVRVAATTRPAADFEILEMQIKAGGYTFDQLEVQNQLITEQELNNFCLSLTEYAKYNVNLLEKSSEIVDMTVNRLLSAGVIHERDGHYIPTNAYNILAGIPFNGVQMNIQCALFKGYTKVFILDSLTCSGPLYKQIDQAINFLQKTIRVGNKLIGAQMVPAYEFPMMTIRELLINAVCHRSYLIPAQIQVALYDDRLEITSPGMLMPGLTLESIREGYSLIRNRSIAEIFRYLRLFEGWGSGIPKAIQECKDYGLKEPELVASDSTFKISIYRKNPIPPLEDF